MKKILVLLAAVLLSGLVEAATQDVILLKEEGLPPIQGNIVEVSDMTVSYYKGRDSLKIKEIPLYEIKGLLYKNGETQMIQMSKKEWNLKKNLKKEEQAIQRERKQIVQSLQDTEDFKDGLITQIGHTYYIGGQAVSRDLCVNIMKENCPIAYKQFMRGHKKMKAGYAVMGVGLGLGCVLAPILAGCAPYYHYYPEGLTYSAIFFGAAGGVMTLASIPVICINAAKRNDAFGVYNSSVLEKRIATIKVQGTPEGGIGVAMEF